MGAQTSDDDVLTLMLLLAGASGMGLFSVGAFSAPVQAWMLSVGILTAGEGVLLGWENGVGLDLPRVIIGVGILLLLLVLFIAVMRKRARRDV